MIIFTLQKFLLNPDNLSTLISAKPESYESLIILSTVNRKKLRKILIDYINTISYLFSNMNKLNFLKQKKILMMMIIQQQ